jgi:hypothetical protein
VDRRCQRGWYKGPCANRNAGVTHLRGRWRGRIGNHTTNPLRRWRRGSPNGLGRDASAILVTWTAPVLSSRSLKLVWTPLQCHGITERSPLSRVTSVGEGRFDGRIQGSRRCLQRSYSAAGDQGCGWRTRTTAAVSLTVISDPRPPSGMPAGVVAEKAGSWRQDAAAPNSHPGRPPSGSRPSRRIASSS